MTNTETKTKKCAKCKTFKEFSMFPKGNDRNGLYSYCYDCTSARNTQYYSDNYEKETKRIRTYQSDNKEDLALKRKNNPRTKKYFRDYKRNRYNSDPLYKLTCNIRRTVSELFRGKKSKKTVELVGCTFEELKAHLESLFRPGMTWENYGEWHIDHKYPLSLAKSTEELEKLCHFTNLQPLWAEDNLKKSNKTNL